MKSGMRAKTKQQVSFFATAKFKINLHVYTNTYARTLFPLKCLVLKGIVDFKGRNELCVVSESTFE